MKNREIIIVFLLVLFATVAANAQQGFGTSNPAPSSVIDMVASDKGFLVPRVTLTGTTDTTTVPSPANSLTVFNTATDGTAPDNVLPGYYYWSTAESKWVRLIDKVGWDLQGNAGTDPANGTGSGTDFLGTTDNTDFQIKVGTNFPYNNIMRVSNAKGHTQFGNWLNLSSSPNHQNADKFQNGASIQDYTSPFTVANNFGAADLTGNVVNNTRSAAYVNATSSLPFFSNYLHTQFNNGYTGAISGSTVNLRLDGAGNYTPSGANLIAANQSIVGLLGNSTITTTGGTAGFLGTISNSTGSTINGPVYGIWGRTSTGGTYNGTVVGAKGSLEGTGSYNGTTIGTQGSITLGTFGAGTSSFGLHSNTIASGIANGYGLYIEDVAGTVSQNGVYQAGTNDNNYFGGNTKIGTTGVASNKLHVAAAANPVRFEGLQATVATGESVLVTDANGVIKTIAQSAVAANNIYTTNGTLTGNRTVTMGTNSLSFANGSNRFNLNHTATAANASLLATDRANMRWGAGTSYLDIFQDTGAIGQIAVSGASTGLQVGSANGSSTPVYIMTNGTNRISVLANGNVGIGTDNMLGTANAAIKLAVNGSILTTNSTYADYVFEDYFKGSSTIKADYKFKSLSEVEKFINENKHLPGVTGIEGLNKNENGEFVFNVSELSVQVLEKVEELYLHTIAQQKLLEAKDKEIQELKSTTQQMNERLERLEQLLLEKK